MATLPADDLQAYAIGQRIRELRTRLGLRQEDLARRTGIARPNIARLEFGRHLPSLSSLTKIAAGLRVAVGDLIVPPPASGLPPDEQELIEAGMSDFSEALHREDNAR